MKTLYMLLLIFASPVIPASAQNATEKKPPDTPPPVAENKMICVVGNVMNPSLITLRDSITLMQAIKQAGGAVPDTNSVTVRIYRDNSKDGTKEVIIIKKLRAVEKGRAVDLNLQSGDVVEIVPRYKKKRVPQSRVDPCFSKPLGPIL
jgi:hypothetical protein